MDIDNTFLTSVNEAVQKCLKRNVPLFVFLSREDGESTQLVEKLLLGNEKFTQFIQSNFICLKLMDNTVEIGYFRQIFKNLVIPSFYFVYKENLLEVVTEEWTEERFRKRLEQLAELKQNKDERSFQLSRNSSSHISEPSGADTTPSSKTSKKMDNSESTNRKHAEKRKISTEYNKSKRDDSSRIRALGQADKRERKAKSADVLVPSGHKVVDITPEVPKEDDKEKCHLSIELFNSESIRHSFANDQTLSDVRAWLDSEVGYQSLGDTSTSLPPFATSSYPEPTSYVFHRPAIPRITYSTEQETKTLLQLDLHPRSALILKPIYDHDDSTCSYPKGASAISVLKGACSYVRSLGNALYSFFDYGVDTSTLDMIAEGEIGGDPDDLLHNTSSTSTGGSFNGTLQPGFIRREDRLHFYSDERASPDIMLGDGSHPALINVDNAPSPVPTLSSRSTNGTPVEFPPNSISNANEPISICSTPRPLSTVPSLTSARNFQTLRDESNSRINESNKDYSTYNGNSVNLDDHNDE